MPINPLILISRILPEEFEVMTGEFLDRLHLVLSASDIHHSSNRDEVFLIVKEALTEIDIISIKEEDKKVLIKQGSNAKRIIKEYGN